VSGTVILREHVVLKVRSAKELLEEAKQISVGQKRVMRRTKTEPIVPPSSTAAGGMTNRLLTRVSAGKPYMAVFDIDWR